MDTRGKAPRVPRQRRDPLAVLLTLLAALLATATLLLVIVATVYLLQNAAP